MFCLRLLVFFTFAILSIFVFENDALASNANTGASGVICDFIMFFTGRIMRAMMIIIMMGMAFLTFNGSISWQKALTVIAAIAIIFGAKNLAVMLLSSKITNIQGTVGNKVFNAQSTYTPDEIIAAACPQL